MVFMIDESCLVALDNGDKNAIIALEMLALNRIKCNNYIFAEKRILENLMKRKCFTEAVRKVFEGLFNRSIENKLFLNIVYKYILLVEGEIRNRVSIINGQEVCKITLEELATSDLSNTTLFITENTNDSKFYSLMANSYAKSKSLKKCYCDFMELTGGGGTTAKTLKENVEKADRLCLCIVDSDKKFFDDTPGDTMQKVKEYVEGKEQDKWKAIMLDVHEVENLIPIKWIEEVTKDIGHINISLEFLKYLSQKFQKGDLSIYFFDLKNGIKKEQFVCMDNEDITVLKKYRKYERFRNYWKSYLEEYGIELNNIETDYIVPGTCKNILERVIEKYKDGHINEIIDAHLIPKWNELGKIIFSWVCVGSKIAF